MCIWIFESKQLRAHTYTNALCIFTRLSTHQDQEIDLLASFFPKRSVVNPGSFCLIRNWQMANRKEKNRENNNPMKSFSVWRFSIHSKDGPEEVWDEKNTVPLYIHCYSMTCLWWASYESSKQQLSTSFEHSCIITRKFLFRCDRSSIFHEFDALGRQIRLTTCNDVVAPERLICRHHFWKCMVLCYRFHRINKQTISMNETSLSHIFAGRCESNTFSIGSQRWTTATTKTTTVISGWIG